MSLDTHPPFDQAEQYQSLLDLLQKAETSKPNIDLLTSIADGLVAVGIPLPREAHTRQWDKSFFIHGKEAGTNGEEFQKRFHHYISLLTNALEKKTFISVQQRIHQEGMIQWIDQMKELLKKTKPR